jgi:hypothetical protein
MTAERRVEEMAECNIPEPKCIQRARKNVKALQKWGRWMGLGYITLGIACFAIPCMITALLYRLAMDHLAIAPNNPVLQQQFQQQNNAEMEGYATGLIGGFAAGFIFFRGLYEIGSGINFLRGDPTSQTLVKYYDTFLELTRKEDGPMSSVPNAS